MQSINVIILWCRGQIVRKDNNFRIKAERGLKHVRSNELHGKTAHPGNRGTDIVACNKNARTGKIDGPDYKVTYRLSALWFPGYKAVKELKESQILVSESQRSRKTTGQK